MPVCMPKERTQSLSALKDEELVALYLAEEITPELKNRIRSELQGRYYPECDPKQRLPGYLFKRRVYAVLTAHAGSHEQVEECYEECCKDIFDKLFLTATGFDNLLSKFDPGRGKSFQYWVINVRVRTAATDWWRKNREKCKSSMPIDDTQGLEPMAPAGDESAKLPPGKGLWMWQDALLPPRYGTIIRLLFLAYLDLDDYYVREVAYGSGKAEGDVRAEIGLLQQRLRPVRRFGDSEEMEIYALDKVLETLPEHARFDERTLTATIADAGQETRKKFSDRPPVKEKELQKTLLETLAGQLVVGELKRIVRRWIEFLEGELIEGKLLALTEEVERREKAVERNEEHLRHLGLSDQEITALLRQTKGLTLQRIKEKQREATSQRKQAQVSNERRKAAERRKQALAYQEQVLRLTKAKHKRDELRLLYTSGKYMVIPLQRELASLLGLKMGTIGGRISEAQRALKGAVIWQQILGEFEKLDGTACHQRSSDRLKKTCVVSFEHGILMIGVPGEEEVIEWTEWLPRLEEMLRKPPLQETVARYEQTGMTVKVTVYRGKWPPLTLGLGDAASGPESAYQLED